MNWHCLIVEVEGRLELLSFQGRAIAFDLDSECDRERIKGLTDHYRLVRLGSSVCPMPATEWYQRCARGEKASPQIEEGPPAMPVCMACGQIISDSASPTPEGISACRSCKQAVEPEGNEQ